MFAIGTKNGKGWLNMLESKIVYSAMKTPDGTLIRSRHVHDYQTHEDAVNGKHYMIDGGLVYVRSSCNGDGESFTITLEDDHEIVRKYVDWGTYGKNGDESLHYIKLMDMETGHIEAILETQKHVHPNLKQAMINELEYRDNES